jgi:hypothetical protein
LSSQFDSLTICKAQSHVVIKYSIHVFDPNSVYWSIKNYPSFFITSFLSC